jgi:transposase
VDVHKQSVTAVAVDEAGRMLDEKTVPVGSEELLEWVSALSEGRLWAVEDCRRLTRWLERQLLAAGGELVRVPPKLMAPERRSGKGRGKSDAIDALAIARAALREPDLARPRPDEGPFRELKLLVDHRDAIVDERRRVHQRLRWHLHQLDPTFAVPLRMLARKSHLERVSRWLRQEEELQVTLARELVTRCRALDREVAELDRQLERRSAAIAPALLELPGCGAITAAKLLAEIGPIGRFRSDAQLGPAQRRSAARGELSPNPAPSTRPWRQPPTQRRARPDGDYTGAHHPQARAYLERKRAEGKTRREANRCPQALPRPQPLATTRTRSASGDLTFIEASLAQPGLLAYDSARRPSARCARSPRSVLRGRIRRCFLSRRVMSG